MAEIVVDGYRVTTEQRDQAGGYRILVDGAPVPMTLTRTETIIGNISTSTRQTEPPRAVDWLPDTAWPDSARISLHPDRTVDVSYSEETGYVYNTAVWRWVRILLTFNPAYTHVDVSWNHTADVST
ncbi:hypothetical protein [Parafrankia sp. EUN1f]|uniref:hypothetical protein n=1 Tax=Parafrankia sp. EUN1f TaxID=102897 RepID=UPI0001C442A8|nr:hypothetical protein [Parafrankia sp. EUN1f]EFC85141.1 hypothetical protein FrEUN1fDRAFT_1770 [Parafrankia sp. EUN1f]